MPKNKRGYENLEHAEASSIGPEVACLGLLWLGVFCPGRLDGRADSQ